jgi:hypothetical protein
MPCCGLDMHRTLKQWVALVLLAAAAFAQAALPAQACPMERGGLSHAGASEAPCAEGGGECDTQALVNLCVAHCTADLQQVGPGVPQVTAAQWMLALLPPGDEARGVALRISPPPPGVPIRILHQSLQI